MPSGVVLIPGPRPPPWGAFVASGVPSVVSSSVPCVDEPAADEKLSLADAAAMFDRPKSRAALEQLVARGVLDAWKERDARGTHTDDLDDQGGARTLRRLESAQWSLRAQEALGAEVSRAEALEQVIADLVNENAALRVRVAELKARLGHRS